MLVCLHERDEIAAYLRRDRGLHLYEYGDLDPFFWPHTLWYGWREGGQLTALVLFYLGDAIPVLLAMHRQPEAMAPLLKALQPLLPRCFYAHMSEGLESFFEPPRSGGEPYYRMLLQSPDKLTEIGRSPELEARQMQVSDAARLQAFFDTHYPDNWFNPRMLSTGHYYGLLQAGAAEKGEIWAAGGIHVVAQEYGVAAIGNIAVHQAQRRKGLGQQVTAAVATSLLWATEGAATKVIGLNVHQHNQAALRCYRHLGFEVHASYREWSFGS